MHFWSVKVMKPIHDISAMQASNMATTSKDAVGTLYTALNRAGVRNCVRVLLYHQNFWRSSTRCVQNTCWCLPKRQTTTFLHVCYVSCIYSRRYSCHCARQEGIEGNGGTPPLILNFCTRWTCVVKFTVQPLFFRRTAPPRCPPKRGGEGVGLDSLSVLKNSLVPQQKFNDFCKLFT
jgi:hypothetical protein